MIVPVTFFSMLFSARRKREQDPEKNTGLTDGALPIDTSLRTASNMQKHDYHASNDALHSITASQSNTSPGSKPRLSTLIRRFKSIVYPHLPFTNSTYRVFPIISGIFIPFSVLLEIPGLTGHWYIRTEENKIIEIRPNPLSLDIAMGFSMASAAIATAALLVRFSERQVKLMTLICIFCLCVHDVINIIAVTSFGVIHRFDDGFTYGQSFWMTVCSSIVSVITSITLIIDYIRVPDFGKSGSGLTRSQRSLLVSIIILLCYIALGALVHSKLIDLAFIDALYFTVATIETIGFGDIVPLTAGARVFTCTYAVIGIVNLALTVNLIRDSLLEAIQFRLQKRLHKARIKEREQRIRDRWRDALKWRLKSSGQPLYVKDADDETRHGPGWALDLGRGIRRTLGILVRSSPKRRRSFLRRHQPPRGMHLNIESLSKAQLEAAAFEAGVPLDKLLPPGFELPEGNSAKLGISRGRSRSLTHTRVGYMASLIGKVGIAVAMGMSEEDILDGQEAKPDESSSSNRETTSPEGEALADLEEVEDDIEEEVEEEEKREFYAHLAFAWGIFVVFWMVGSAIFMKTEEWPFEVAMYFCFIAFTTLGYGDYTLKTPAGRSIFVVWALLGVGTMTILISIIQEAYAARYKKVIHTEALEEAVEIYHEELSEKARGKKKLKLDVPPLQMGPETSGMLSGTSLEGTTAVNTSFPPLSPVHEVVSQRMLEDLAARVQKYTQYLHQLVILSESTNNSSSEGQVRELNYILVQVPGTESLRRRVNVAAAFDDSNSRQIFIKLAMERIINEILSVTQEVVSRQ